MYLRLYRRHHGLHSFRKEIKVNADMKNIVITIDNDYEIKENLLLEVIPDGFLPNNKHSCVLLTVADDCGSTGIRGLSIFMNWAKYFDAYVLELGE